jgi:hypothetical protein
MGQPNWSDHVQAYCPAVSLPCRTRFEGALKKMKEIAEAK